MKLLKEFSQDDFYHVEKVINDAINTLYKVYDDVANSKGKKFIDDFVGSVLLVMKDDMEEII